MTSEKGKIYVHAFERVVPNQSAPRVSTLTDQLDSAIDLRIKYSHFCSNTLYL